MLTEHFYGGFPVEIYSERISCEGDTSDLEFLVVSVSFQPSIQGPCEEMAVTGLFEIEMGKEPCGSGNHAVETEGKVYQHRVDVVENKTLLA